MAARPTLKNKSLGLPVTGYAVLRGQGIVLSDLGYRAQYRLPDLLIREGEDPNASLYTPAQIFPTGPVTITGLHKRIIDVPGAKNAWIGIVKQPSAAFGSANAKVNNYY